MKIILFVVGLACIAANGYSLEHNGPTVGNLIGLLVGVAVLMLTTFFMIRKAIRPKNVRTLTENTARENPLMYRREDPYGVIRDIRTGKKID